MLKKLLIETFIIILRNHALHSKMLWSDHSKFSTGHIAQNFYITYITVLPCYTAVPLQATYIFTSRLLINYWLDTWYLHRIIKVQKPVLKTFRSPLARSLSELGRTLSVLRTDSSYMLQSYLCVQRHGDPPTGCWEERPSGQFVLSLFSQEIKSLDESLRQGPSSPSLLLIYIPSLL